MDSYQEYIFVTIVLNWLILLTLLILWCCLECIRYVSLRKRHCIVYEDPKPPSYDEAMKAGELDPPTYAQAQSMIQ